MVDKVKRTGLTVESATIVAVVLDRIVAVVPDTICPIAGDSSSLVLFFNLDGKRQKMTNFDFGCVTIVTKLAERMRALERLLDVRRRRIRRRVREKRQICQGRSGDWLGRSETLHVTLVCFSRTCFIYEMKESFRRSWNGIEAGAGRKYETSMKDLGPKRLKFVDDSRLHVHYDRDISCL